MSMAPPPPPSPMGHRSTSSAPISGLPNSKPMPFGTPSRPAPSYSRPPTPQASVRPSPHNNTRPASPYTHVPSHSHSQPTRDTRLTTSYGTPYGQHTIPSNPSMSAASSVSAASAAVDSPRRDYVPSTAHYDDTNPRFNRRTDHNTGSGFSDPSSGSRIVDNSGLRLEQSAPSTPARHRVSRSVGCYPVSPVVEARRQGLESPSQAKVVEPSLPPAPSVWTPSELAQYLSWALRTGGADGQGPTLPAPVVEDVVTWVLRSRVTGRQFVIGVDQGVTRPPPFLPVLAAMSRRLRRRGASRPSDTRTESDLGSDVESQVTRVRRLAHAFDVISSASEASDSEGPSLSMLREQITGESVQGYGRAVPKADMRNWARRDSVASIASGVSVVSAGSSMSWRPADTSTSASVWVGDVADDEYARTNSSPTAPLRAKAEARAALELAELANISGQKSGLSSDSPPPPYDNASAVPSPTCAGLLFPPTTARGSPVTPSASDANRSGSLTPLRHSFSPEPNSSPSPSTHMVRMGGHRASGVDPYAVLRRSSRGGRPSALLFTQEENKEENEGSESGDSDAENKPLNSQHWSMTRRVTARPLRPLNPVTLSPAATAAKTPSKPNAAGTPSSLRRRRELSMAREVANLNGRIRELEDRLALVETPAASALGIGNQTNQDGVNTPEKENKEEAKEAKRTDKTPHALVPRLSGGWLAFIGLADADGTEPRLQDVPAVLFLLGVGVGVGFSAVVVRLLLHRRVAA